MTPTLLTRRLAALVVLVVAAVAVGSAAPASQSAPKPPAPTNLRVTDVGWDFVELAWDAPSIELDWSWSYEITNVTTGQREFAGFWQTSDRPPFSLQPETTYTFEIRLVNHPKGVRSAPSNRVSVTTLPLPHVAPPTNLRATDVYSFSAYFSWDPSPDAVRYRLVNLTTGSGHLHTATTNVPHPLLRPGQTFSFEVVAVDGSGVVSAPSNRVTITTPTVDPPDDVAAERDGNDVTLTWTRPDYLDPARGRSYVVYDRGAVVALATARDEVGDTAVVELPRVASGVTHEYAVQVRDWLAVQGHVSEPSDPLTVAVPPSGDTMPPTAPQAVIEVDAATGISTFRITAQSTDDTTAQSEIRYEGLRRWSVDFYAYHHDVPLVLSEDAGIAFPDQGIRAVDEAGNRSARVVPEFVIIE